MSGGRSDRRTFLRTAAAMGALGSTGVHAVQAAARQVSPEQRVRELGLQLPEPQGPSATLVPAVLSGNMLYCSGHGARGPEDFTVRGKVGDDMTLEHATDVARLVGLNMLATVRNAVGSLDRVERLVKTFGMVNSAPDFTGQSRVINGFSQLMIDVFGEELGKGARSAVGMAALPVGWAVEIEAIFQVRA